MKLRSACARCIRRLIEATYLQPATLPLISVECSPSKVIQSARYAIKCTTRVQTKFITQTVQQKHLDMSTQQVHPPDIDDDDEDTGVYIPHRRTIVACQFCRGRKLKCDGRQTCSNCHKRGIPCTYPSQPVHTQGEPPS
ncbi:hypothetical protein ABKN59_007728 [Abortiporus biennis]